MDQPWHVPEYTLSLLIWIIPIILMWCFFWGRDLLKPVQKEALGLNIAVLAGVGCLLDLLFAKFFFRFPDKAQTLGIDIKGIPIEEFIFYVTGFWFIIFFYVFCDEYFLLKYNKSDDIYAKFAKRLKKKIYAQFTHKYVWLCLFLFGSAVVFKAALGTTEGWLPGYFLFLTLFAYVPFVLFYKVTRKLVNSRAFFMTVLLTTLISVIWEVTLALPRGYWNYNPNQMVGFFLSAWSWLPIEAVTVWLFSSLIIFGYEYTKVVLFKKRRGASNELPVNTKS